MVQMVQTTFKNLYVQDAFKDVLRLLLQSFEPSTLNDIAFKNENVRCRLVRARDDRMTFNAYAIGEDTDYEILHCTAFYHKSYNSDLTFSHFRLLQECDNIGFSTYRKDCTALRISHASKGIMEQADQCILRYPLEEEQVFQQLTRFPVPLEMDIDFFMSTGEYVMQGITDFDAYSFMSGWIADDKLDETNKESMVQSVQEVLEGLIQVEKDRIDARDEEWAEKVERDHFSEDK